MAGGNRKQTGVKRKRLSTVREPVAEINKDRLDQYGPMRRQRQQTNAPIIIIKNLKFETVAEKANNQELSEGDADDVAEGGMNMDNGNDESDQDQELDDQEGQVEDIEPDEQDENIDGDNASELLLRNSIRNISEVVDKNYSTRLTRSTSKPATFSYDEVKRRKPEAPSVSFFEPSKDTLNAIDEAHVELINDLTQAEEMLFLFNQIPTDALDGAGLQKYYEIELTLQQQLIEASKREVAFVDNEYCGDQYVEMMAAAAVAARGNKLPIAPHVLKFVQKGIAGPPPLDEYCGRCINSETSTKRTTVAQFTKAVVDFGSVHNFARSDTEGLFNLLHELTDLLLPIKKNEKTGNLISTIDKCIQQDLRVNNVDACIKECMLYLNEHETSISCPTCQTPRYSPCGYNGNCKYGEQCSPFINVTHKYRSPKKVVIYRSIIIKLIQMCKEAVGGSGIFDYNETRRKQEGYMSDVNDGDMLIYHMADMREMFLLFESTFPNPHSRRIVEISLVLSMFYDGGELFKKVKGSIWPMLVSVLNCDPSYRTKLGLGLFAVALHSLSVGGGAERDMMNELFSAELSQGQNGINFEATDSNGELVIVFLQFRCAVVTADTKAAEKIWCFQSSGSINGCPYCACKGLTRDIIGARVFHCGCLHLPQDHVFRTSGEDKEMPEGYYGEVRAVNEALGKRFTLAAKEVVIQMHDADIRRRAAEPAPTMVVNYGVAGDIRFHRRVHASYSSKTAGIKRGFIPLPAGTSWVDMESKWGHFAGHVYIPFDDDRPHKSYEETRNTNDDYIEFSNNAKMGEAQFFLDNHRAPANPIVSNGVFANIPKFSLLKGPLFHHQGPDPMHTWANTFNYNMQLVMGQRGLSLTSRQLSVYFSRFLYLQDDRIRPPFVATMAAQIDADSAVYCMNVPSAYATDYRYNVLPFKQRKSMNSHQKMVFYVAYIEYVFSYLDIDVAYKRFFARYARDVRRLLCPRICRANIPTIVKLVDETKALQEFMFPDSEAPVVLHQIVDIAHNLQLHGSLKNIMCNPGERAMKQFTDATPDGGPEFTFTTGVRVAAKEQAASLYDAKYKTNKEKYTDNTGLYSPMVMKMLKGFEPLALSVVQKDMLFQSAREFLSTQEIECLVSKSSFVRLYFTYEELFANREGELSGLNDSVVFPTTLTEWIHSLYDAYQASAAFNYYSVKHLANGFVAPDDEVALALVSLNDGAVKSAEEQEQIDHLVISRLVTAGKLFLSDFTGIISDMARLAVKGKQPLAAFKHAVVKGVELTGRGVKYTEPGFVVLPDHGGTNGVGLHNQEYVVQNSVNILAENWPDLAQGNSWGSVSDYYLKSVMDEVGVEEEVAEKNLQKLLHKLLVSKGLNSKVGVARLSEMMNADDAAYALLTQEIAASLKLSSVEMAKELVVQWQAKILQKLLQKLLVSKGLNSKVGVARLSEMMNAGDAAYASLAQEIAASLKLSSVEMAKELVVQWQAEKKGESRMESTEAAARMLLNTKKKYFCQFNCFFRMYLPSDSIIHGVPFANAVLRNPVFDKHTRHCYVSTTDTESYYPHKQFVCLHYVDSTAVATVAKDETGLPILNPKWMSKAHSKDGLENYTLKFSPHNANEAVRLDLIELHKERMPLQYDSIEFDTENVKVMEQSVVDHHNSLR